LSAFVVDASVALAWYFGDEISALADAAFIASDSALFVVPSHWYNEVANGIWAGERRARSAVNDVAPFVSWLSGRVIEVDDIEPELSLSTILPLARETGLTVYDALYLELAMRRDLPIATLDNRLAAAAKKAGVKLFL
jgi:predicted nucleic acid-binding protein